MVGAALTLIGLFSKNSKRLIKLGLIISATPIAIVTIPLIFGSLVSLFKYKPSQRELVGEYEIVEVTNLDFDKNSYNKYILILKSDSTFTLTHTPYVEVCENGKYELDYSNDNNELAYQCGGGFIMGHIDRGFGDYRIEFVIGDPDSGESIYFGKRTK